MSPVTRTVHNKPYPAISPFLPALSQAGRTVLVAGGSTGIGYAIARAFANASASKIILLGRRPDLVTSAASSLIKEVCKSFTGQIIGHACDIADAASVAALWESLKQDGIMIDVLVLNASVFAEKGTILDLGPKVVRKDFQVNVFANLDMSEKFWKQDTGSKKVRCKKFSNSDFRFISKVPQYWI
jgi:NAD(P)-dependent dehydrogenase (short-subunit alcohol dehydrogenase family)